MQVDLTKCPLLPPFPPLTPNLACFQPLDSSHQGPLVGVIVRLIPECVGGKHRCEPAIWWAQKLCLQASRGWPGWVPQDSFPLSWQLLSPTPVLQEVWPPAVSRGRREAEEPVYHHAKRGPSAREGQ